MIIEVGRRGPVPLESARKIVCHLRSAHRRTSLLAGQGSAVRAPANEATRGLSRWEPGSSRVGETTAPHLSIGSLDRLERRVNVQNGDQPSYILDDEVMRQEPTRPLFRSNQQPPIMRWPRSASVVPQSHARDLSQPRARPRFSVLPCWTSIPASANVERKKYNWIAANKIYVEWKAYRYGNPSANHPMAACDGTYLRPQKDMYMCSDLSRFLSAVGTKGRRKTVPRTNMLSSEFVEH